MRQLSLWHKLARNFTSWAKIKWILHHMSMNSLFTHSNLQFKGLATLLAAPAALQAQSLRSLAGSTAKVAVAFGAAAIGLAATALPSSAFTIYTGFDPNGNPSVNLVSTTGIPVSSAAQAAFLANLVGTGTETFESFAIGTSAPLAIVFPGAGNATLIGSGHINFTPAGTTNGVGRYGVSATNFWEVNAGSAGNFDINFSVPVAAFGFYGIDIGDFAGTLSLIFDNGNIATQSIPTASISVADGSVLYWGIITNPSEGDISSISFKTTAGTGDIFAFDNMTIGSRQQVKSSAVPGPLPLFGAGAAFGWSRKLRRRIGTAAITPSQT